MSDPFDRAFFTVIGLGELACAILLGVYGHPPVDADISAGVVGVPATAVLVVAWHPRWRR